jgi:hypothetical protein
MTRAEQEAQDWWTNVFLTLGDDIEPRYRMAYMAHAGYLAGFKKALELVRNELEQIPSLDGAITVGEAMEAIRNLDK